MDVSCVVSCSVFEFRAFELFSFCVAICDVEEFVQTWLRFDSEFGFLSTFKPSRLKFEI